MLGERKQLREETGTLEKTLRELENERNGLAVEKQVWRLSRNRMRTG